MSDPTHSLSRAALAAIATRFELDPEGDEITLRDTAICHSGAHVTFWGSYEISKDGRISEVGAIRLHDWQDGSIPIITLYLRRP